MRMMLVLRGRLHGLSEKSAFFTEIGRTIVLETLLQEVGTSNMKMVGIPTAMTLQWWQWLYCAQVDLQRKRRQYEESIGFSRCRTMMVDGRHSIEPVIAQFLNVFHLRITTRCKIPRVQTSLGVSLNVFHGMGCVLAIPQ
jgi:hypothetical protein